MPPLLLTMRQVSELTGIKYETLRTWRKQGRGGPPSLTLDTGAVRYRHADVIEWVASLTPERAGATGTDG